MNPFTRNIFILDEWGVGLDVCRVQQTKGITSKSSQSTLTEHINQLDLHGLVDIKSYAVGDFQRE